MDMVNIFNFSNKDYLILKGNTASYMKIEFFQVVIIKWLILNVCVYYIINNWILSLINDIISK